MITKKYAYKLQTGTYQITLQKHVSFINYDVLLVLELLFLFSLRSYNTKRDSNTVSAMLLPWERM
jgi:hypothetical protein